MKQISKTLLILALCAWTSTGTCVLNASTSNRTAHLKKWKYASIVLAMNVRNIEILS